MLCFILLQDLETLISPYGVVVSTRILRDHAGASRGVGFARSALVGHTV